MEGVTVQQPYMGSVTPKLTESYEPYMEYCPRCQRNVMTRVEEIRGNCWWYICLLGCFVLWPLWYWLCCQSSHDARHHCPSCNSVLSIKRGGCS